MTIFIILMLLFAWSWALLCVGFRCGAGWGIDEMKRALDESGFTISKSIRKGGR